MAKWELVEENIDDIMTTSNPILGLSDTCRCRYDLYRKLRRNGLYKYKQVRR